MLIKASRLTNLTDARYFAAKDVQFLGFNLEAGTPGHLDPMYMRAIREWVQGPVILGEFMEFSAEQRIAHGPSRITRPEISIQIAADAKTQGFNPADGAHWGLEGRGPGLARTGRDVAFAGLEPLSARDHPAAQAGSSNPNPRFGRYRDAATRENFCKLVHAGV